MATVVLTTVRSGSPKQTTPLLDTAGSDPAADHADDPGRGARPLGGLDGSHPSGDHARRKAIGRIGLRCYSARINVTMPRSAWITTWQWMSQMPGFVTRTFAIAALPGPSGITSPSTGSPFTKTGLPPCMCQEWY